MKTILTIIAICISITVKAQSDDVSKCLEAIASEYKMDENGIVTYEKIIEVEGTSKDELFKRSMTFIANNYGSGKEVIQVSDKEAGYIIGKGIFSKVTTYLGSAQINVPHTLRVDVKDNKAKISISIEKLDYQAANGTTTLPWSDMYPFNEKRGAKNLYGKAWCNTHETAKNTLIRIEEELKKNGSEW